MSCFFNLDSGERVEVIMLRHQGARLTSTCFRGQRCQQAGNFFAWNSFRDFLMDPEVRELLVHKLENLVEEGRVQFEHRFELEFSSDVGWDSVMDCNDLTPEDLAMGEERRLNGRATAIFLPDTQILAPRTNIVTMVLRMKHDKHWKFTIGTMYPGLDCGKLEGGNLTETRGLVWMSWTNPGE